MIYFNKLIDICINRQESQKVVNNYFVGTIDLSILLEFLISLFFYLKRWLSIQFVYKNNLIFIEIK